ncbi:MAG TPA: hypothetical protein PLP24_05125 [Acetivibrio thermocellus]|nr:hypothetical protein [Acetivibrio thermocellus]
MDNRFKYHRSFLIFTHEDSRNGEGREPSGYVKIEIRDGRGKLCCQVSNLRESNDAVYKLYLINVDEAGLKAACPGVIDLAKGKGELIWNFDPANIDGTGMSVCDINVAAVILENNNERYIDNILCPLAAYKNGKIEWRQKMKKFLNKQRAQEAEETEERQDFEEAQETGESQRTQDIPKKEEMQKTERAQRTKDDAMPKTGSEKSEDGGKIGEDIASGNENIEDKNKNMIESVQRKEDNKSGADTIVEENGRGGVSDDDERKTKIEAENEVEDKNEKENENETESKDEFGNKRKAGSEINFEELVAKFDRCFEKCNPFMSGRKDYRWWKIAGPVHLNNILYQMKVDVPILFNPLVLMAHFKYRHLIVGTYEDKARNLRYIVCGVPGVYWVDEKPFGKICRWAQVDGNVPKYGAFGYWLVYINPNTGEILNVG